MKLHRRDGAWCWRAFSEDGSRSGGSLRHMWAVAPPTEAHVLLALGSGGGRRSLLSRAEKQRRCSVSVTAPILGPKSADRSVESVERGSPLLPSSSSSSSSHQLFLGWASADVYFSWRVLAGAEPPISHILIG